MLSLPPQDAPDLNLTFARPVNVQISGSALLYELDGSVVADETAVSRIDGHFSGIRRVLIESHLRYSFVRYGVPYFVSIECFDGASSSRRLSCREADEDRHALPQSPQRRRRRAAGERDEPRAAADRAAGSGVADFTYFAAGDILPGTSSRSRRPCQFHGDTAKSAFPWRKRRLMPTRSRS